MEMVIKMTFVIRLRMKFKMAFLRIKTINLNRFQADYEADA